MILLFPTAAILEISVASQKGKCVNVLLDDRRKSYMLHLFWCVIVCFYFVGKCIASQSKATFFSISASTLTSKWVSSMRQTT